MKEPRGAAKKRGSALLGVWLPVRMVKTLDRAAAFLKLDRAKFLRSAVKEKIARKKT